MPSRDILFRLKAEDDTRQAVQSARRGIQSVEDKLERLDDTDISVGVDVDTSELDNLAVDFESEAGNGTGNPFADAGAGAGGAFVGGFRKGLGALAVIGGGAALLDNYFEGVLDQRNIAATLDLPVRLVSGIRNFARTSGTDFDEIVDGFRDLRRNAAEALTDPSGSIAAAFKTLGIDVEDFVSATSEEQFQIYLRALAGLTDGVGNDTEEQAAAFQIMGEQIDRVFRNVNEYITVDYLESLGTLNQKQAEQLESAAQQWETFQLKVEEIATTVVTRAINAAAAVATAIAGAEARLDGFPSTNAGKRTLDEALAGAGRATELNSPTGNLQVVRQPDGSYTVEEVAPPDPSALEGTPGRFTAVQIESIRRTGQPGPPSVPFSTRQGNPVDTSGVPQPPPITPGFTVRADVVVDGEVVAQGNIRALDPTSRRGLPPGVRRRPRQ